MSPPLLRQGGRLCTLFNGAGASVASVELALSEGRTGSAPVKAVLGCGRSGEDVQGLWDFEQPMACTPPAASCAKGVKHLAVRVPARHAALGTRDAAFLFHR